jgi:ATPase subunit of ABC transporter with duplicated ATPase domains
MNSHGVSIRQLSKPTAAGHSAASVNLETRRACLSARLGAGKTTLLRILATR